jgi:branched-chain amino acid transport system substrate-binding protein
MDRRDAAAGLPDLVPPKEPDGARPMNRHILAALGLALSSTSCVLIVDRSPAQCEIDSDCAAFPGTVCTPEQVCGPPPCSVNQDCIAKLGEHHVCLDQGVCANLKSAECTIVEGDYDRDGALLFGVVVPTEGEAGTTGLSINNGIRLALREIDQAANGLPPAPGFEARRPLAFVGCNDKSDGDTAVLAARHLTSLGLPAILGAAFSGITIKMATEVTIPAQTLLISPSATSVAITDLDDGGLVWRTAPSDIYQARAVGQYVPAIEADVRAALMLQPADKVRLAILHKGDAYGSGLGKAVELDLQLNGAAALDTSNSGSYLRFDYGDPDNPSANPPKYEQAVQQALSMAPHILLILGTAEGVVDMFQPIEAGWQAAHRARVIFSDGGVVNQLWDYVGANAELRRRVTGTVPGTTNLFFNAFRGEYNTQYMGDGTSPDVFGAAGAYDAAYLLAYSAVSLGGAQITGPGLAEGLKKMVPPGTPVNVGTDAINGAFASLSNGESIDFNGASGPLDFDVATGEAPSDIQIWCLPAGPGGAAQSAVGSGLFLDAATGQLVGAMSSVCD